MKLVRHNALDTKPAGALLDDFARCYARAVVNDALRKYHFRAIPRRGERARITLTWERRLIA